MEAWKSGCALRSSYVEVWRYGALEARCRRADVEVWRHRAFEVWKRVAGSATGRYGGTSKRAARLRRTEVVGVELRY